MKRLAARSPSKTVVELYGPKAVEKAFLYSSDKLRFSFFTSIINQALDNMFLYFYIYHTLWNVATKISSKVSAYYQSELLVSSVFAILYGTLVLLLSIPFSIYSTFYIEKKHGFNKQTAYTFWTDLAKNWALSIMFGIPLLGFLLKIISYAGAYFVPMAWLFTFVVQLLLILIFPSVIQPLFNKFEHLQEGSLKASIKSLSQRVSFPLKEIFVMDGSRRSSHSNAYFFGLFNSKRIVLFDTLIENSSQEQICAILAHELGHWACSHLWKRLLFIQTQTFIMYFALSKFSNNSSFFESFGFLNERPTLIGLLLVQALISPITVIFEYISNYLSRFQEFEADGYAQKLGYGETLKTALVNIHKENLSNPDPDYLYCLTHYSHPPLADRLAAIDVKLK